MVKICISGLNEYCAWCAKASIYANYKNCYFCNQLINSGLCILCMQIIKITCVKCFNKTSICPIIEDTVVWQDANS